MQLTWLNKNIRKNLTKFYQIIVKIDLLFIFFFRNKNEWEKDRRNRLNTTFNLLAERLPQYDPSKPFSKIEILQKTILLIEEIQKKNKELLGGCNTTVLSKY